MSPLNHFREIVTTDRRAQELADFDGQVIGTFCNFVPEELVLAAGAVPVRLCASDPAAVPAGETCLPRDICPIVKSTAGRVKQAEGLYGRADALVVPTPCDAKKKLGAVLAAMKPVHVLDLPPRKDGPGVRAFWQTQVRSLVQALEGWTGRRISRASLGEAIALTNRRHLAFRRFLALRAADPPLLSGQDALFVTQASFIDDLARWTEHAEALCDGLEAELASRHGDTRPRRARLLLTGAPLMHPNHRVIELLEGDGARVVIDELCSGTQRLYQPATLRESSLKAMIEAVAEKVLLPTTCPCFVEGQDRINRILELAETSRVDGVVYHSLRLCTLFDIESLAVQHALRERGLPMLTLSTDFSSEDTGQLRTRVEAFVEMVGR